MVEGSVAVVNEWLSKDGARGMGTIIVLCAPQGTSRMVAMIRIVLVVFDGLEVPVSASHEMPRKSRKTASQLQGERVRR